MPNDVNNSHTVSESSGVKMLEFLKKKMSCPHDCKPCENCDCPFKHRMHTVVSWSDPYLSTVVFLSGIIFIHLVASGKWSIVPLISLLLAAYLATGFAKVKLFKQTPKEHKDLDEETIQVHAEKLTKMAACVGGKYHTAFNWTEPRLSVKVMLVLLAVAVVGQLVTVSCVARLAWIAFFVHGPLMKHMKHCPMKFDPKHLSQAVVDAIPGLKSAVGESVGKAKDFYMTKVHPQIMEKLKKPSAAKKSE